MNVHDAKNGSIWYYNTIIVYCWEAVSMPSLSKSIVVNVEANYIETYLKQRGLVRTDAESGQELNYWVDSLFKENKIDILEFEKFLFEELFWGKRKSIRIYKLDNVNKLKLPDDWLLIFEEKYNVNSLNFINILGTIPDNEQMLKIAAVVSEENYKGEFSKLQILFVKRVEVYERKQLLESIAYIPVEIDFVKKTLSLKVWNRNSLQADYRPDELFEHIRSILLWSFNVKTKSYGFKHKKVLYNMSRGLIADIYEKIPAYNKIEKLADLISNFEQEIYRNVELENTIEEDEKIILPKGVLDFGDELYKLIEKLTVCDYFFDRSYEEIWNMGVDAIIAKIRFNDAEHVLTSLSGEATEVPIFCTKTFMALIKSMEDAEVVERIWISKNRTRGKLDLRYDATNEEFLGIMVLSNIRFKEDDLLAAVEIYRSYESKVIKQITAENRRNVV